MMHTPLPKRHTRFSVDVRFRARQLDGSLDAAFEVTNGLELVGSELLFTVKPAACK